MGRYPTSCDEVYKDIDERHKKFINDGWKPLPVNNDAILYRLVLNDKYDFNTKKPSKSSFSDYGLSVYIECERYPFNINSFFETVDQDKFIGVVKFIAKEIIDMGFEICADPHPDPFGNQQHENHAQIICKKTTGKTRKISEMCEWVIYPKFLKTN